MVYTVLKEDKKLLLGGAFPGRSFPWQSVPWVELPLVENSWESNLGT